MPLTIRADVPPLCEDEDGVVRIAGTRIPLERVVRQFLAGLTPEQIVQNFDVLAIEDVYSVISYYLHNRGEIDTYLATVEKDEAKTREEFARAFDPTGIRARLIARRAQKCE